jgi:hypothetical protein
MHRGKKRVPTHRFAVKDGTAFAYVTGIAKGKRVDVDERRMRGYPGERLAIPQKAVDLTPTRR